MLQIDRTLLSMFCTWSVTLWKLVSRGTPPPHPSEITAFEPPLLLGTSNELPWGWGGGGYGYIFWNHALNQKVGCSNIFSSGRREFIDFNNMETKLQTSTQECNMCSWLFRDIFCKLLGLTIYGSFNIFVNREQLQKLVQGLHHPLPLDLHHLPLPQFKHRHQLLLVKIPNEELQLPCSVK